MANSLVSLLPGAEGEGTNGSSREAAALVDMGIGSADIGVDMDILFRNKKK